MAKGPAVDGDRRAPSREKKRFSIADNVKDKKRSTRVKPSSSRRASKEGATTTPRRRLSSDDREKGKRSSSPRRRSHEKRSSKRRSSTNHTCRTAVFTFVALIIYARVRQRPPPLDSSLDASVIEARANIRGGTTPPGGATSLDAPADFDELAKPATKKRDKKDGAEPSPASSDGKGGGNKKDTPKPATEKRDKKEHVQGALGATSIRKAVSHDEQKLVPLSSMLRGYSEQQQQQQQGSYPGQPQQQQKQGSYPGQQQQQQGSYPGQQQQQQQQGSYPGQPQLQQQQGSYPGQPQQQQQGSYPGQQQQQQPQLINPFQQPQQQAAYPEQPNTDPNNPNNGALTSGQWQPPPADSQQQREPVPPALTGMAATNVATRLSNFRDSWDPFDANAIPMFWHIPKSGGSSIKNALGGCHRLIMATEFGVTDGHESDPAAAVVYPRIPGAGPDADRSPFVNVDVTTVAGIARAKAIGFADAALAEVVVSPFLYETNDLFTPTAKGRLFTVFRHPVDRAVSMFYYIQGADWGPDIKGWTLARYARSNIVENNWMTRQLSGQLTGDLTENNVQVAMEVVRTKILVGLMSDIESSMGRFEKYFQWIFRVNPAAQDECRKGLVSKGGRTNSDTVNQRENPKRGDEEWELLAHQNQYDLKLFDYIEILHKEQEAFVTGKPEEYRNAGATCCKCDPPTVPPEGFACPTPVKNSRRRLTTADSSGVRGG